MTNLENTLVKPPQIDVENFDLWTTVFESYVRGKSRKMWEIITDGDYFPTKFENHVEIPKPAGEWSTYEDALVCLNFEAKVMIFASLTKDELERVYFCKTAYEMWEKLNTTHRGNTQVKSSKINILVHDYEMFEMMKDETIDSMFKRFNNIMLSLKGLGREYPNGDYIQKILRALPPEWMPNVTPPTRIPDSYPKPESRSGVRRHELPSKYHRHQSKHPN